MLPAKAVFLLAVSYKFLPVYALTGIFPIKIIIPKEQTCVKKDTVSHNREIQCLEIRANGRCVCQKERPHYKCSTRSLISCVRP